MVKKFFFLQCIKTVRFHNEIKSPSSVLLGTSGGPATLGRTTLGGPPPSTLFVIKNSHPCLAWLLRVAPDTGSQGTPPTNLDSEALNASI